MRKKRNILFLCFMVVFLMIGTILFVINKPPIVSEISVFNENISFEQTLGEIYIPPNTDYVLSLYFKQSSDSNSKAILPTHEVIKYNIEFNDPAVKVISYEVSKTNSKSDLYELVMVLNISEEIHSKIEEVSIGGQKHKIGSILIHSVENSDLDIKRSFALGKEFTTYEAAVENLTDSPISLTALNCGSFEDAVQSTTWILNGVSYRGEEMNQEIILGPESFITISIAFDHEKISRDNKVILFSPKIIYSTEGILKEFFLPYCIYNRLT